MTRGFLSDVLAKWKRFRWQGLVKVWAMFMAIALVLLVESLGVHYGATRFDITYLDRDKAIPAADAIAGEKATNLLVIDSSQEGVSDAEAMLDQILLDMKVPTTTVDVSDDGDCHAQLGSVGRTCAADHAMGQKGRRRHVRHDPGENRLSGCDRPADRH